MGSLPIRRQLLRIKPADEINAEGDVGTLKRSMGPLALTFLGVGSIVGSGIFVILGEAIPKAGPAVLLSFVLAAITCAFSALAYAELAGSIPVSGSSYSYAYATLGEIVAWVCGWCLMLEYGVSASAVAVGWGQYLNEFLTTFGIQIPDALANPPGTAGGVFNLPAVVVVTMCAFLLMRGVSESAKVNTLMVSLKICILLFFCAVAFTNFTPGNFAPFLPLGFVGVSAAAGQLFFSYVGFDAASAAGEEAKNAKRDLPRAIILSLVIVTFLYILVGAAAIGARPWEDFEGSGAEAVLAQIAQVASGSNWAPAIISLGAVISIFSVVLVTIYGQTRILFAMGRDGLLPKLFTRVNPRTQTPITNTILVSLAISLLAGLVPLGRLAEAVSIGTLFAFVIVNFGVIALWISRPELPRTFKVPLMPLTPILGVLFCLYLILSLEAATWTVFAVWLSIGLIVYFFYSRRRSTAPPDRPSNLPDDLASRELSSRGIRAGTLIGIAMVLVLGFLALKYPGSHPFLGGWAKAAWWLTAAGSLVGAVIAGFGLVQDQSARRAAAAGDVATAARKLRKSVLVIAIALVLPGVLAAVSSTVASHEDEYDYIQQHPSERCHVDDPGCQPTQ